MTTLSTIAHPTPVVPPAPRSRLRGWDWRAEGIFVAVWIGLGVAIYTLGYQPQAEARRQSASDSDRFTVHEQELATVRSQTADARRRLEKATKQREQNPIQLGRPSAINERLKDITALADSCGIKLDRLEPEKPILYTRCAIVPIHIGGSTTFPGLVGFFNRLHTEFRDTAAPGFKLSANQDQSNPAGRFEIELAWYTALEAKPAAK